MAHYAKVVDGKVVNVIVAEAEFFNSFVDESPGSWVDTSSKKGVFMIQGNYDGIGFYNDRPFDMNGESCTSWTLNSTSYVWESPLTMPSDGKSYDWDESVYQSDNTKGWVEVIDVLDK